MLRGSPALLSVCKSSSFPWGPRLRIACSDSSRSTWESGSPWIWPQGWGCRYGGAGGPWLWALISHSCWLSTYSVWKAQEASFEPHEASHLLWGPDPFPRSWGCNRVHAFVLESLAHPAPVPPCPRSLSELTGNMTTASWLPIPPHLSPPPPRIPHPILARFIAQLCSCAASATRPSIAKRQRPCSTGQTGGRGVGVGGGACGQMGGPMPWLSSGESPPCLFWQWVWAGSACPQPPRASLLSFGFPGHVTSMKQGWCLPLGSMCLDWTCSLPVLLTVLSRYRAWSVAGIQYRAHGWTNATLSHHFVPLLPVHCYPSP